MAFSVRRKIKYGLFISFVIVLVAVFYLTSVGLPRAVVQKIEPYLQFSGMILNLDKIKLSIFEGIVATKVKYYKKGDIGEPILQADRVVLKLEPFAWVRGGKGVSGVFVKNGRLRLALGGEPPSNLILSNIYANVLLNEPSCLRVTSFATDISGLKISGRGRVRMPAETAAVIKKDEKQLAGSTGAKTGAPPALKNVSDFLNSFTAGNNVTLDMDFYVDPDNIEKLSLKINVHGRGTAYDRLTIGAWTANISVTGKTAQGTFALKDAEIAKVWMQSLNGTLNFDGKEVVKASVKGLVGRDAHNGPVALQVSYNLLSDQFDGHATSGCDLRAFVPPFRDLHLKLADIFSDFEFKRSLPSADISFKGGLKPGFTCRLRGEVLTDTLNYKRVSCLLVKVGFDAELFDDGEKVTIKPILIVRDEGLARGQFLYNSENGTITFSAMSMADPKAVSAMIDPLVASALDPFSFDGLCYITTFGTVGLTNSAPNDIEVNFNANDVRWKLFNFATCALTLRVLEKSYRVDDINGTIYRGIINASASIDPLANSSNMLFTVSAKAENIDFGVLVNSLAGKQLESAYEGICSGSINLQGLLEDADGSSIKGDGWIKIEHGRIFTVPIFSGLFDMLCKVIPGMGQFNGVNNAKATLTVENGKVHTRDIFIEGDIFSLKGSGDVYLDGRLDFKVQITFMRQKSLIGNLVQIIALPLTKAFEFHLSGTVSDPKWESSYLPF